MTIWENLNNLDDAVLRALVAAAVHVMQESQSDRGQFPADLPAITTRIASRTIAPDLKTVDESLERGEIQQAMEDEETSRELCLAVLKEISKSSDLAAAIEEEYLESQQKLSSPELILMVGALLVLAIKIKEIHYVSKGKSKTGKKEFVIEFFPATAILKETIAKLISLAHG